MPVTEKGRIHVNELTAEALDDEYSSVLCENMSFAAAEAYKLLRTNIMFSFSDESNCHIVGVTSALRGEGKSVTAINTSYALAQLGKSVLLIDGDLRIPSVAKKLNIAPKPGLSNVLVGLSTFDNAVQHCKYPKTGVRFDILVSGDIPPNPSEMLGSEKMKSLVKYLTERYNYIIIDVPPVVPVSDGLVVSRYVDGMLVVVRQDYCQRAPLFEIVNQLSFVDARVLGFVFNYATETSGGYSKRYGHYYGRSYRKRNEKYYSGYEHE